jgi:hypothetical protein
MESRSLLSSYLIATAWFLLIVWLCWLVGIEAINGHLTPFYGLVFLSFRIHSIFWVIPPAVLALIFYFILRSFTTGRDWDAWGESPKSQWKFLSCVVMGAALFAASIAMIRGGLDGISQAYDRQAYEYIIDIGKGLSIRGLFADYEKLHPYLSMHAKVHPPGPIAILWMLSYGVGRSPLGLSIATIFFGSVSVVPLYFWVKDMCCTRTAMMTSVLYGTMPTIVLFTATSADITFMPFTLATLFLFWRAITRSSIRYGLAAGVGYGLMTIISFSLIGVGIFFGLVGLWFLRTAETRGAVIKTAATMVVGLLGFHLLIYFWSGMNIVHVFEMSKNQFDIDQMHLDELDPRYSSWVFKIINPMCWFFYAGIPISVLCLRQFFEKNDARAWSWGFALSLIVLNFLYLGRGEGERSAMHIMPFIVIPAGYWLSERVKDVGSWNPFWVTWGFLVVQCWLTEIVLYTYW